MKLNKTRKNWLIYSFVLLMFFICIGIGIAYFVIKSDANVSSHIKLILEYTWNVLVLINVSFIPIKIINTIYTSAKNLKEINAKKPLKVKEKVIKEKILKHNIFYEIDNILDSNLPDHVKRSEIKKLIKNRKE